MTELTSWTAEDFADSFQRHMPTGPVWPRDPDTTQRATVEALMPTYVRSWDVACDLPTETLPSTSTFLLPEWESTLGLPDPCAGEDPTIAQRQAHVVARLTQGNGPSIPSLTAFAAALGYTITITEFAPARADNLVADGAVYDPAWAFAWQVNAPGFVIDYFSADESYADEPLATWASRVLQCELQRIAPAHTILMFSYVTALPSATWDGTGGWNTGAWAA